jgi:hypothetical protein
MMVGLLGLLTCVVIGAIVAGIERRSHEGNEITAIAVAGAVAGMYVGRMLELYVAFGELGGLICSAVGAVALVRIYHAQTADRRMQDVPPPFDSEYLPSPPSARMSAAPPDVAAPPRSLPGLLAEASGWGVACAFLTAPAGFLAHLVGSRLYPQPYEQIPSDFFFVPLGMLAGFVAAGVARLTSRQWGTVAMASFIGLVSIGYAGVMFQYSRVHSMPANVTAVIEPEEPDPIACSPDKCEATDPPTQWYVTGRLRLKDTTGLGATVDRIEISSTTYATGPVTPHPYTKEAAAEAARWRGPNITLSGRHVPGPRHLAPNVEVTSPLVYAYHTKDGTSRRQIVISVYLTDDAGHRGYASADWKVW